ncbi:AI-2E family transporter [Halorientalis pallida]|uniref:AI-2E family transporter n=1 Tax=Halorientalis pallida TaxID=2479928 RepID=A0A498L224_9EURY|nr:AI-2E family transporter [Halorientalis pallida]RXK51341.1 AI-2E family transporter [Halorientalis pallida]
MTEGDSPTRDVRVWMAREDLGWWVLGLALAAVLALIVERYLAWLVFGLFVYYVGRPVSRRLERYLPSKSIAATVTLLVIVVPVVALLGVVLLIALGQLLEILADAPVEAIVSQLPVQIPAIPQTSDAIVRTTTDLVRDPSVQTLLGEVGGVVGAVSVTLYNLFIAILLAFFLLVSDRSIASWFEDNVFGTESRAVEFFRTVDDGLGSVFFGYTTTIFAIMILSTLIYATLNAVAPAGLLIPSVVLLGVVTGVFTLIPMVGRSIIYLFIAALLAVQAAPVDPRLLWYPVAFYGVMGVAFDFVVRTYIRPYLSGRQLQTGLVMFAYLLGPPLFGWYGIFLGPLVLVLLVTFLRRILPALVGPDRDEPSTPTLHRLDEYQTQAESPTREGKRGGAEPG